MVVDIAIPVLNPGRAAERLVEALASQTLKPASIIVIDSSSDDGWVSAFERISARTHRIARSDFDHGATRNLALQLSSADIVVFMTQDAIPCDKFALERLVAELLRTPTTGVAYGRQIPHGGATPEAAHARSVSYPERSARRSKRD